MNCFTNPGKSSILCSLILFGIGVFLTILTVVLVIFIYRIIRKRQKMKSERSGSIDLFGDNELPSIFHHSLSDSVQFNDDRSSSHDLFEDYNKLQSKYAPNDILSDNKTNHKNKKKINKKNETKIIKPKEKIKNNNITEKINDKNDNLEKIDKLDKENLNEGINDDKINQHRLSEVGDSIVQFQHVIKQQKTKDESIETSFGTVIIEETSFNSVEKSNDVIAVVELPTSAVEASNGVYKSSSSETLSLYRSSSVRPSVQLYSSISQKLTIIPQFCMNLATHIVPTSLSNRKQKTGSIDTLADKDNTLANATSLTKSGSKIIKSELKKSNQRKTIPQIHQLSYKTQTKTSLNDTTTKPLYSHKQQQRQKQQLENSNNLYNYMENKTALIATNQLYGYVPQFVISICVNTLLNNS